MWRSLFKSRLLLASLAALGIAAIVFSFHDPFDFDDRPNIEPVLRLAAACAQADLAAGMEKRILEQVRLAQLLEVSPGQWELAANLFLTHHPGSMQLLRLDTAGQRTQQIVALPQTTRIDEFDPLAGTHIRELFGAVIESGS